MALIPWKNKQCEHEGAEAKASSLATLRHELDRVFGSFFREPLSALDWPLGRGWGPAVDVIEGDKDVTVRAEIPGIDPKDLDVSITGNELVLAGEKRESSERSGKAYHLAEARYGSFRRVVLLPSGVDRENVEADYTNGVLTVRLQKTTAAEAKRIEVRGGE